VPQAAHGTNPAGHDVRSAARGDPSRRRMEISEHRASRLRSGQYRRHMLTIFKPSASLSGAIEKVARIVHAGLSGWNKILWQVRMGIIEKPITNVTCQGSVNSTSSPPTACTIRATFSMRRSKIAEG